jgi:hypothetical protein
MSQNLLIDPEVAKELTSIIIDFKATYWGRVVWPIT